MARERYLLNDDTEEGIHSNIITLDNNKDKFKNWWHYHYKLLLIIIAAVIVVVYSVISILNTVRPDYSIGYMSRQYIMPELESYIENELAAYGEDLNGDGQVIVHISNYYMGTGDTTDSDSMAAIQASAVKMASDLSEGTSVLWLHDLFGYDYMTSGGEDTNLFVDFADGEDPKMIYWEDVSALNNLDYTAYDEMLGETYDYELSLQNLRLSIRSLSGNFANKDGSDETYKANQEFLDRLLTDTKLN